MLMMVLQYLGDSSKDETGVKWEWWGQHNRKGVWYKALIRENVSIRLPILKDTIAQSKYVAVQYRGGCISSVGSLR
jgi:hypothetical protein